MISNDDPFKVGQYWRAWRIWGREVEKIPDSELDKMTVSLLGEPPHPIPPCGCSPHFLCAEGSRLSKLATALVPSYSWPPTRPGAVQAYEAYERAINRYWAHIRPDNPNARQEWFEFLKRSGM